jgi:hypothetical protein
MSFNVFKEHVTFRIEEYAKHKTSIKQVARRVCAGFLKAELCMLSALCWFLAWFAF